MHSTMEGVSIPRISYGYSLESIKKERLRHRCFPASFVKFLRTSCYIEHLWWLLLKYVTRDSWNIVNGRKIRFFHQIIEVLEYLKTICSHPHLNILEEVNVCVKKLKNQEDNLNLNIRSKLRFIVTAWKVPKYRVFSGPYFPVFRLNTGKYRPEKTLY